MVHRDPVDNGSTRRAQTLGGSRSTGLEGVLVRLVEEGVAPGETTHSVIIAGTAHECEGQPRRAANAGAGPSQLCFSEMREEVSSLCLRGLVRS